MLTASDFCCECTSTTVLLCILSNTLERKDRLVTGLKFFGSLTSSPFFFSSGRTTACLKSDGKIPDTSDLLKSSAMNGDNSRPTSFTSQVGTGSNWHVLFRAEPIIFSTSSCVTAVHWESVGVPLSGTSYSGVVEVEAQTESTLSLKYVANSSAVLLPVSSVTASHSTPCSVRHSFCELPLFAEIVVRQKLLRLAL